MKILGDKYKKNGYEFTLIERTGQVAIYSQIVPETGRLIAFEVFEVQKYPEKIIAGKIIPAFEATPSNEQWGLKGYTVHTFFEAKKKGAILQERIRKRKLAKTYKLSFELGEIGTANVNAFEPQVENPEAMTT